MRKIAAMEDFFSDEHRRQIEETAKKVGFTVDFYPRDTLTPDRKSVV